MRQDKWGSIRKIEVLSHCWQNLDYLKYNKLNMGVKTVKKVKIPTVAQRQKIVAKNLEYNLYFNKRIKEFDKKQLDYDQLYDFRKDLKDKGIADLSAYWNDAINTKISFPGRKLHKVLESGIHISSTEINDEFAHMIYVYPETSVRDVKKAFRVLQQKMEKTTVQPLGNLSNRIYDLVYKRLTEGKRAKQIFDEIYNINGLPTVEQKTVEKIVRRMKKGL
ncbi:MAG: hypothetical protein BWZ03_00320 [bacterium ADurb.BinA186]|nr:MAG: hypothetical protein BWZ03_00320 [bacterium ADurb.BinA186]